MKTAEKITLGKTFIGIEFGSTRIKACLIDEAYTPLAAGSYAWENKLENGYWTYSREEIINGLQVCFASLCKDVSDKYGVTLETTAAMGISAMMHGYLAFDENDRLLVPFRTWRNTTTAQAAEELSEALCFNIPQRWTCAHLYQAVLSGEEHIGKIAHVTTLAGYIHFLLTGKRAVGMGEASGIFPISGAGYDSKKAEAYNAKLREHGFSKTMREVFPKVLLAGESAGTLTEDGARLLCPDGTFKAGCPLCPCEGDAGTGMTATNSVRKATGNISAGTSIFSMLVLEKPLKSFYPEIDMVTTPDGLPCAMVHCNNCCSELDAWVKAFAEFANETDMNKAYKRFYYKAAEGASDCGGVCSYNLLSGEPVLGVKDGRPMYFRLPDSKMSLANFARSQIYSAFAALRIGMDILFEKEECNAEIFTCHGGMFKVRGVAQQILSSALNTPCAVMSTAGEGGAWGMALLAAYMVKRDGKTLADWLDGVFANMESYKLCPDRTMNKGFNDFMELYKNNLESQKAFSGKK